MPAITGETEKGRSINVINRLLPRNSNLVIVHAAATPKTRLIGTAMAAVSKVSSIAERASGSATASQYAPSPRLSASAKTTTNGRTRKNSRKVSATPVRIQRTMAGSVNGSRTGAAMRGAAGALPAMASTAMTPPGPRLDQVEREQQQERGDQHQRRDGRRAGKVELFELHDDQQRNDLRHARQVARNENDRPVLADGARESQRVAGQQGRR